MLLEELIKDEREEAKEEGKIEGKAELLLGFLSGLGEVSEELRKKIQEESDPDVILSYLQKAAKSTDIEEFMEQIR